MTLMDRTETGLMRIFEVNLKSSKRQVPSCWAAGENKKREGGGRGREGTPETRDRDRQTACKHEQPEPGK